MNNLKTIFNTFVVMGFLFCESTLGAATSAPVEKIIFDYHANSVTCVTFCPDGKTVVCGRSDGIVRLLDLETNGQICDFKCSSCVISVEFCLTNILKAKLSDGKVILWNLDSKELIQQYDEVINAKFNEIHSPDDKFLIYGFMEGKIFLCDLKDGQSYEFPREMIVTSLAFNLNSTLIALGFVNGVVNLWDLETKKMIHKFDDNSDRITSIAFSSDGTKIAAAGGVLVIWKIS